MSASTPTPARGRPFDTRLGEDLAVLCALSREDATARAEDISSLLGVDVKRATEILHCLSTGTVEGGDDENIGPMLALYGTDERGSLSQVAVAKAQRSIALRLTPAQAQAVASGFDRLGIGRSDAIRQHVEAAFFPLNDSEGRGEQEGRPGSPSNEREVDPGALPALIVCARSQVSARANANDPSLVEQTAMTFGYQGDNDQITRTRRIAPRAARLHEGQWIVDAYDLDARAPRSFLANRMVSPRLLDMTACVPREASEVPGQGSVRLTCTKAVAARVRSWEGARELSRGEQAVVIEVPYYRGDWLPRHVLALGSQVTHSNAELAAAMREIAEDDLRRARRFHA